MNGDPRAGHDPDERDAPAWRGIALEALVAFVTPALFLGASLLIRVNPRDRLGQISGLAALELRFFLFGLVLVAALLLAARARGDRAFALTSRLVCAGVAGLASALVAGGVLVALRGTAWGLHTKGGDVSALVTWAKALHDGQAIPPLYPPLPLHVLHGASDVLGLPPEHAVKQLQIIGTAAFGPVAYLGWRLHLRPPWALALGVIAMLPLIDPYKPYTHLVLIVFVPVAIKFLQTLRTIGDGTRLDTIRASVGFGVGFGLLFLAYSGWFKWAAPGVFLATLVVFPWRGARRRALLLLGLTGLVFLLMSGRYLAGVMLDPAGKIVDKFIYFDVGVEPMYIAMWRNDLPGVLATWPPLGELGGVGLFTSLLIGGFGLAVALGRKHTIVIGLAAMMLGAWLLRFWYARSLWETKLVQLYPRTTPLILYCLIVMTGAGVMWLVERAAADHPLRGRGGTIGAVCGLLLLFASAGSALGDRYMPSNTTPPGPGLLAYTAQQADRAARPKYQSSRPMPWLRIAAPAPVLPAAPGAGPATPGAGPATPGASPATPGAGPATPRTGPATPGAASVPPGAASVPHRGRPAAPVPAPAAPVPAATAPAAADAPAVAPARRATPV